MQNSTILQFDKTLWNAPGKVKHSTVQGKEIAKLRSFEKFKDKASKLNASLNPAPTEVNSNVAATSTVPPITNNINASSNSNIMAKFNGMTPISAKDPKVTNILQALAEKKNVLGTNRLRVSGLVADKARLAGQEIDRTVEVQTPAVEAPPVQVTEVAPAAPPVAPIAEPTMVVTPTEVEPPKESNPPVASEVMPKEPTAATEVTPEVPSNSAFDFGKTVNLSELAEEETKEEQEVTETSQEEVAPYSNTVSTLMTNQEKDEKLNDILNHVHDTITEPPMKEEKKVMSSVDRLAKIKDAIAEREAAVSKLEAENRELEEENAKKEIAAQKELDAANDYLAELAMRETEQERKRQELLAKANQYDALLDRKMARLMNEKMSSLTFDDETLNEEKGLAA